MKNILLLISLTIFSVLESYTQINESINQDNNLIDFQFENNFIESQDSSNYLNSDLIRTDSKFEFDSTALKKFLNHPRILKPHGISIVIFDYIFEEMFLAEIEYNYFPDPNISFGINTGIDVNGNTFLSVGPRYYFNIEKTKNKLAPFIGCQIGTAFNLDDIKSATFQVQIPVGFELIFENGFALGMQLSSRYLKNNNTTLFLTGLKFGKYF